MFSSPVVRVFTTSMPTCFDMPWQKKRPEKGSGSGVFLGDGLILTGAHVIHEATFIQVQKLSSAKRVIAELYSVCHDADLALLKVEDENFFNDLQPATVGELPNIKDQVEVVGFPMGGEQVSVTNGVVSRIEVSTYSHSWRNLLCVTIDAAINPGNSGGPVFNNDGQVIGIAFQKPSNAENSGQMVPPPVINTFLESAFNGQKLIQFPKLGMVTQKLENPMLCKKFQLPEDETGILVTQICHGSNVHGKLEVGDIIQKIQGHEISSLGTIQYRNQYRTKFTAILSECTIGNIVNLTIRRNGEPMNMDVKLDSYQSLVPREEGISNPYFVYAGLVFQPLTRKYIQTWKSIRNVPVILSYHYRYALRTEQRDEIVVIGQILSDEVNVGYDNLIYHIIDEVNQVPIKNLNHLVELTENSPNEIQFKTTLDEYIIFSKQQVHERLPHILNRYQIQKDRYLESKR